MDTEKSNQTLGIYFPVPRVVISPTMRPVTRMTYHRHPLANNRNTKCREKRMGRIQDALHRAEAKRQDKRSEPTQLVRLLHQTGSLKNKEQRFHMESILLGRATHNDVAYDPFEDATVSAQHAEIRQEGEFYVIYDMGSLNGTFVNGFMIRRAILEIGDQIALGRRGPTFLFELEHDYLDPAAGPGFEFSRTPPRPRAIDLDDCPDTERIPIFEEEEKQVTPSSVMNLFLFMILAGITIDVILNLMRLF